MKNIKSLENFTNDKQKSKYTQTTNVAKTKARPRNFDEFFVESIKKEGINGEMRYLTSRDKWISENKARKVLDKIPTEDLPHCEQIDADHSKVGDFIDKKTFEETYDEDGAVLDELGDNGVLCYAFTNIETKTWWAIKNEKGGISGLYRIK